MNPTRWTVRTVNAKHGCCNPLLYAERTVAMFYRKQDAAAVAEALNAAGVKLANGVTTTEAKP
jgi:hypothetical protein